MAATELLATKLKLSYRQDKTTLTVPNIRNGVSNEDFFMLAHSINALQDKTGDKIFRIEETEVKETA